LPGVGGGNFVAPRFTPPDGLTFNTSTGNFDGTQTGSGEDLTTSIPDFSGATVVTVSTVGTDTDRGTDLRNKINAAARNTIIIVTSGFTYNVGAGFLELPGKGGTGWIWIVSEKIIMVHFQSLLVSALKLLIVVLCRLLQVRIHLVLLTVKTLTQPVHTIGWQD
jgi:hypothetical protein